MPMSYEKLRERALARIAEKRKLAEAQPPAKPTTPPPAPKDEMVTFKDVSSAMAWLKAQTQKGNP